MKIFIVLLWGWAWQILAGTAEDLVSLDISINGIRNTCTAGELITVFYGDHLRIESATLTNGSRPSLVNLIGFRRSEEGDPYDDRHKTVVIGKDLNPKWSREGRGVRYDVIVSSNNKVHGTLFLEVKIPQLEEIEISLNGTPQKVRPGQVIRMKESDQFRLKQVRANFDTKDTQFRYEIVSTPEKPKLVFQRNGWEVASFPIYLR